MPDGSLVIVAFSVDHPSVQQNNNATTENTPIAKCDDLVFLLPFFSLLFSAVLGSLDNCIFVLVDALVFGLPRM